MNIAKTIVPEEFKRNNIIKQLKVKFNREFLNDILAYNTYKTDTENMYVHKIEKDVIYICNIIILWQQKHTTESIVDADKK